MSNEYQFNFITQDCRIYLPVLYNDERYVNRETAPSSGVFPAAATGIVVSIRDEDG